ncbi:MAG: DNA replication/repair protein RecF [Acidiferrobacteraceae bacterium]
MLVDLEIRDLRIIERAASRCHPTGNLILGRNGSGKTTLLEAIALIATGRSFRTRVGVPVIRFGTQEACVRAHVALGTGGIEERILRCRPGRRDLVLDGTPTVQHTAAQGLPVTVLSQDTAAGLAESAEHRRRLLFWLMFHVEPRFTVTWARYRRSLEQRNAALLRGDRGLSAWDVPIVQQGEELLGYARSALALWSAAWPHFSDCLGIGTIQADLNPGFTGGSFGSALAVAADTDRRRRFTTVGPHRLDLTLRLDGRAIGLFASQGQTKLVSAALTIAQTDVIRRLRGTAIGLVDDLPAALDHEHARRLWGLLREIPAQWFVSAPSDEWPYDEWGSVFHVEQGRIESR